MSNTSTPVKSAKQAVDDVVERTREAVNHGLDVARESFDDAADRLDLKYRKTAGDLRAKATRVSRGAREKLGAANAYVGANPGKSLLIAAGIGFLAGQVLHRRFAES